MGEDREGFWLGFKAAVFGLAVLAGAAVYVTMNPELIHGVQEAVTVTGSPVAGGHHSVTGNASGTSGSGKDAAHQNSSGSLPAAPKGSAGIGATSVISAQPIAVTTDNAPPPTPTVLDGVQVQYDPLRPSDGPYPDIAGDKHLWFDVSISQQLAYLFDGDKLLYTFVTSTGIDTNPGNSTPLGVYHVQAQRGTWFYSQQYAMGAQYWVSWKGHGIFLFHSVPMNQDEQILPQIAAKLGHKASHGCFHLTVPDAKWVYENIPYGTTIVVEQAPLELQGKSVYDPSPDQLAAEVGGAVASGTSGGTSSGSSNT